jgi:hypothetical protein
VAGKVRTWVWIAVAVVVVGILCLVALAGVGFYFASQHIQTRAVSPAVAVRDFDEIRARFKGQRPLIELDERGEFLRANTERPAAPQARRPEHLHVVAYDPEDGQLVRVTVPFWLLRWKTGGASIDFNGRKVELEDLRLSVDDLERYGPTLIAEHKTSEGKQVIVFSQ